MKPLVLKITNVAKNRKFEVMS